MGSKQQGADITARSREAAGHIWSPMSQNAQQLVAFALSGYQIWLCIHKPITIQIIYLLLEHSSRGHGRLAVTAVSRNYMAA